MADTSEQQGSLKQFLSSIATIKGDLSNITAPPFVLADKSTTEFPRFWIEHPELFSAPAKETTPERRILAVLKWFLSSLKAQQYAGREPSDGAKKPLNAFLGECFVGECGAPGEECKLVSEQVSHHPPVTACYLWNDKYGVRAEGYTRQEITFTGTVNIQQIGHAVMHIDEYDEDYLVPLPNVKIKGILTGSPYPELVGSYSIVSSSGYTAEIDFSGKGFLGVGGKKNHVNAHIYQTHDKQSSHSNAIFTVDGSWTEILIFKDAHGTEIDTYDILSSPAAPFRTEPLENQDPWESQNAWRQVMAAIHKGDMQGVADAKSALEDAQRELRKHDETSEEAWRPIFFRDVKSNPVAEKLLNLAGGRLDAQSTRGVWRFDAEAAVRLERPWRGALTPYGKKEG